MIGWFQNYCSIFIKESYDILIVLICIYCGIICISLYWCYFFIPACKCVCVCLICCLYRIGRYHYIFSAMIGCFCYYTSVFIKESYCIVNIWWFIYRFIYNIAYSFCWDFFIPARKCVIISLITFPDRIRRNYNLLIGIIYSFWNNAVIIIYKLNRIIL